MLLLSEGRIFDGHNAREMRWMAWFGMAQVRTERRRHGEKRIRQFKRHLRIKDEFKYSRVRTFEHFTF